MTTLLVGSNLRAGEFAAGLSAVEEGDDRVRPGAMMHLGIGQSFFSRAYIYGRKFGPITERTSLLSGNYRFPIYGNGSNFTGAIGGSMLLEETIVEAEKDSGEEDIHAKQYNFGPTFGFSYRVPLKVVYLSLSWDSHLYVAGTAGIFMSSARKQMISLTTGFVF